MRFLWFYFPKAPAKRSQHFNATYRNIVGRNKLRAFGHPVMYCMYCDVLRHVGCCWFKFENCQIFHATFVDIAMLYFFGHVHATMLRQGMRTSSICSTQNVATRCNRVAKRTQYVAPNNVVICCVEMLRSFGRGLSPSLMVHKARTQTLRGIGKIR